MTPPVLHSDMGDASTRDSPRTPLMQQTDKDKGVQYISLEPYPAPPSDLKKERNLGVRLEQRKRLIQRRRWLVNVEFAMAMAGIVLMIVENELFYVNSFEKDTAVSLVLKTFTSVTTIVLLIAVCMYYRTGIEIHMLDGRVDDPFAVTPIWTWIGLCMEITVCAIHPFPGDIRFPMVTSRGNVRYVSIDGILSVLMMFRLYLAGKFAVVHSRLLNDRSTQYITAVSQAKINLFFVFKAAMTEIPSVVITGIMCTMYMVSCWCMRTCELYYTHRSKVSSVQDAMWLSAITFLTIGYGDVTPRTTCGRFISVVTGLMGLASTALLVAAIARKLEQTRSERYVFNFLTRVHMENERKHAAADVVKMAVKVWILKTRNDSPHSVISIANWRLRNAVRTMRSARATLTTIQEATVGMIEVSQLVTKMSSLVEKSQRTQETVLKRLGTLEKQMSSFRKDVRNLTNAKDNQ